MAGVKFGSALVAGLVLAARRRNVQWWGGCMGQSPHDSL